MWHMVGHMCGAPTHTYRTMANIAPFSATTVIQASEYSYPHNLMQCGRFCDRIGTSVTRLLTIVFRVQLKSWKILKLILHFGLSQMSGFTYFYPLFSQLLIMWYKVGLLSSAVHTGHIAHYRRLPSPWQRHSPILSL